MPQYCETTIFNSPEGQGADPTGHSVRLAQVPQPPSPVVRAWMQGKVSLLAEDGEGKTADLPMDPILGSDLGFDPKILLSAEVQQNQLDKIKGDLSQVEFNLAQWWAQYTGRKNIPLGQAILHVC